MLAAVDVAVAAQTLAAGALVVIGVATVVLTNRLTNATERYAAAAERTIVAQHATIEEMSRTREQAIRPVLVGDIAEGVHGDVYLRVTNVGAGAALDVELRVFWEAEHGGGAGGLDRHASVFLSGEQRWLAAPPEARLTGPTLLHRVRMDGRMNDPALRECVIDDVIEMVIGPPHQRYRYAPIRLTASQEDATRATTWDPRIHDS